MLAVLTFNLSQNSYSENTHLVLSRAIGTDEDLFTLSIDLLLDIRIDLLVCDVFQELSDFDLTILIRTWTEETGGVNTAYVDNSISCAMQIFRQDDVD